MNTKHKLMAMMMVMILSLSMRTYAISPANFPKMDFEIGINNVNTTQEYADLSIKDGVASINGS